MIGGFGSLDQSLGRGAGAGAGAGADAGAGAGAAAHSCEESAVPANQLYAALQRSAPPKLPPPQAGPGLGLGHAAARARSGGACDEVSMPIRLRETAHGSHGGGCQADSNCGDLPRAAGLALAPALAHADELKSNTIHQHEQQTPVAVAAPAPTEIATAEAPSTAIHAQPPMLPVPF